jgi:hypothetical protein
MSASTPKGLRLAKSLIRRAYVATTHQGIAFEAVASLELPEALRWHRLFLKHGPMLALGASAPDEEFRDYRNHMLFPRDSFWGGADTRAESWYRNLVSALGKREWENVAYCTGVLAHYVIDALHPLHTSQSAAENDIHFACDLATWVALPDLQRSARLVSRRGALSVATVSEPLLAVLHSGAEDAYQNYASLSEHTSLDRAVVDPVTAVDAAGRVVLVEVLATQTATLASLISRAIREAAVGAPDVGLVGTGIKALLGWPINSVGNARRLRQGRRALSAMQDEVRVGGHASASLPDDVRVKRDAYAKEFAHGPAMATAPAGSANVVPFEVKPQPGRSVVGTTDDDGSGEVIVFQRRRVAEAIPRPAPRRVEAERPRVRSQALALVAASERMALQSDAQPLPAATRDIAMTARRVHASEAIGLAHAAAAVLVPSGTDNLSSFRDRRAATGLQVRAAPDALQEAPADSPVSASCGVKNEGFPGLTPGQVALLVGAGYADSSAVAAADVEKLCADLLTYATTPDGLACLKAAGPPDISEIRALAIVARAVRAA